MLLVLIHFLKHISRELQFGHVHLGLVIFHRALLLSSEFVVDTLRLITVASERCSGLVKRHSSFLSNRCNHAFLHHLLVAVEVLPEEWGLIPSQSSFFLIQSFLSR